MSRKPVRRRKPGAAARLRPFWFLLFLLFAAVAAGAYALATWPALRPHTIDVSGNRVVSKDAIVDAARIDLQSNEWLQNVHAMALRVERIPYIATASVHRLPPSTIRIVVTERQPFALVGSSTKNAVVADRDLRVLEDAKPTVKWNLPLLDTSLPQLPVAGSFLTQPSVMSLRDDLLALEAAHLVPIVVAHDRYDDAVVTLGTGVRVLFGDEADLAKKIPLVDPILQQVARKDRPIAVLDLRAPSTPVVVYKK